MLLNILFFLVIVAIHAVGWRFVLGHGGFWQAPLFGIYYLAIFALNGLGCFYVIWPRFSQIGHLSPEMSTPFFIIIVFQALFFYAFFALASRYLLPSAPTPSGHKDDPVIAISLTFWTISLALVLLYVLLIGVPFLFAINPLNMGRSALIALRSSSLQNQSGILVRGFYFFPTIAAVFAYIHYLQAGRDSQTLTRSLRAYTFGGIALAALLNVAFLHKTPLVMLLFSLWLARVIILRQNNLRNTLSFGLLAMVVILGLYFVYNPNRSLAQYVSTLLPSIARRIFGSYTQSLEAVIRLVQDEGTWGGITISNPGGIFPYRPIDLPTILHYQIMGKAGNAPVGAAGEGFANFGLPGALLFIVFANFYVFAAQLITDFVGRRNPAQRGCLVIFFTFSVLNLPMASISLSILDPFNMIALFVILVVVHLHEHRPPFLNQKINGAI